MDDLTFLLRALLESLPYIYIQFLPFKNKTRLPFGLCVFGLTALMALFSLGMMHGYDIGIIAHGMLLPLRMIQLLLLLVLTIILVKKDDLFKVFYTFFAVFPYMSAVSAVSRFAAQYLADDNASQYNALIIVQALVTAATYYPVLRLWKQIIVKPLGTEKESFWKVACVVPFSISLVNLIAMENGGIAIEMPILKLFERLALFIGVIACSYFTVHIREQAAKQTALEEQARRDRLLLDVQKHQYDNLAEYIEKTRAARHDFKHHIIVLRHMCEEKDFEAMRAYLADADTGTQKEIGVNISPNRTVNAVFDFYLKKAKESGITFKMDMRISESYGISDSDLCVLLGNILENAIEGCMTVEKDKRFIRIGSSEHADRLYLTFDNSFDGKLKTDYKNMILSRKRDYSRAGVGIQSIHAVVQKYGGLMNIEAKDGVFCLSLTLIKKE
ncbi:MAG: GHKL domain-containing protein [Oscillospiraceae bacterium]|nr:GHKL domain-containing protein [Oscillospiraceae bacterium]MBQ8624524.1 GHKL domain-containing protein [Oscillospiraceae bacterium]